MKEQDNIEKKLSAFIGKYYRNELLRGSIFFFAIGLTYFLLVLLIEYFFWLRPLARTFLFWSFVVVELVLLYRFVLVPLFRLFKLQKGINFKDASVMIGAYFPEVRDKLINTLQLKAQGKNEELLLASVNQRAKELEPIPFTLAIDYRKNARFLKFAVIPIVLFLIINFFYGVLAFESSYKRMVDYETAYEPPAPFTFFLLSDSLSGIQNQDFKLEMEAKGEIVPQNAEIIIDGVAYYMKKEANGRFGYTLEQPMENVKFSFKANDVRSRRYTLKIVKAPVITDFKIKLDYPDYTGRTDEIVRNTGSLSIPEGTKVDWQLNTEATDRISWITKDSTSFFEEIERNTFSFGKRFKRSTAYTIATSNKSLPDYERMDYKLEVLRDEAPIIKVVSKQDTVTGLQIYHYGTISDDYGFTRLRLVYYPEKNLKQKKYKNLKINGARLSQFVTAFPDTLNLEDGIIYSYYFQVIDNDKVNNYKSARSTIFSYNKPTEEALANQQLDQQRETIDKLDKSIKKIDIQDRELQKLSDLQKEKKELSFSEQQQLKNVLGQQKEQRANLQQNTDRLRKNLEDFNKKNPDKSGFNEELQKRLKRNEEQLKQQEKLLDELEKVRDKINKEDLNERLEKLSKQNANSKKSLKQLLELTKRYYVEQKMKRIASDIEKLSDEQMKLALENTEKEYEKQMELNEKFKKAEEALNDLEKENEQLKKPMDLPKDPPLQEAIKKDQEQAEEELEKVEKEENEEEQEHQNRSKMSQKAAKPKQEDAGKKMKKLARQMQSQMAQSGAQTMQEDVEMLRQILDNLLLFSFGQEDLMKDFKSMDDNNPLYSKKLVAQQDLKENFQHVDDSLFALSLRVPQLEETINKEITDINYSIDQALDRLAQNQVEPGGASQQYVVTGSNTLADMLSEILNNMQQQLSGSSGQGKSGPPGKGKGGGEQLSDIIISQKELSKKMGNGSPGEGKKGEQGKDGEQGNKGEQGKNGQNGKEGENGENGKKGQGGENGNGSSSGNGKGNTNEGLSEQRKLEQYEIYKQQEQIRQELQDLIREHGLGEDANRLVKEMEGIENKLLGDGIDEQSKRRLANIMHELLKLKDAQQEQGMENKRESKTNTEGFENRSKSVIPEAENYFKIKEVLNRETLPLNSDYKNRVKNYFREGDDSIQK